MLIAHTRRANPGVNSITASVRSTYGNAHQVLFPSMHWTFVTGGHELESATVPREDEVLDERGELSNLFVIISCYNLYKLHQAGWNETGGICS